ncbi:MAG TPA: phage tail protein [Candidatus Acidoferrales bacterium]|nr:phage tail protein [Candidatus Acidoferrales bacterium]
MPQFSKQPLRFDPYKNFKFRVKFGSSTNYVAGVSKIGVLKRTTAVVEHREGGDPSTPHKSPGLTKYEAITLERGVTHDTDFEVWASKVWNFAGGPGSESSLADFRKDIIIDIFNEAGQKVKSYHVFRCWVSEYQATSDFDSNANAVLIEHIKLENEGWERDLSVTEPTPAQFEPAV